LPIVRQTFSRRDVFGHCPEKSIVNPIMRPEYWYTGSGVMSSSLSFEPNRHRAAFTHVPREVADIVDIGKHALGRRLDRDGAAEHGHGVKA
jgi:hypothetical protein